MSESRQESYWKQLIIPTFYVQGVSTKSICRSAIVDHVSLSVERVDIIWLGGKSTLIHSA